MKILVLSDDFPPHVAGGAGVMAFRITKEFVRQGHEVLVVAATQDSEKIGDSKFEGISVRHFYSKYHDRWRAYVSLYNPAGLRAVSRAIRDFSPDVVHAHNVHMHISYYTLILAKKYVQKVFMTAHDIMSFYPGTFSSFIDPDNLSIPTEFNYRVSLLSMLKTFRFRFNPFRNLVIRYCLSRIDGVIAVSDALKDALVQNKIDKVSVIKNGIDAAAWQISQQESIQFKKQFVDEGSKVILFGGRLSGAKGGELILRAMKRVLEKVPNAKLFVAGRVDYYAERMKRRIDELDMTNAVIFTGWLDEWQSKKAYSAASVVVIPSVCFDSFPNNNLEAFAAHRPVVATCFGGSKEVVINGENGFIVNPFDVEKLSQAIIDLLSDTEKSSQFGQAGYERIVSEFSIEKMGQAYQILFS